jgi:hypothetical protein
MPITVDALTIALTAGIQKYRLVDLGWWNNQVAGNFPEHNQHIVMIYGETVTNTHRLHSTSTSAITSSKFTNPANTGDAAPNFKVKSYLDAPIVCPVGTSGTVQKIAFALVLEDQADQYELISSTNETSFTGGVGNNATTIPASTISADDKDKYGDIYMVITVSSGIVVTQGGFLTVKGFSAGVAGSDSFTYVTLQSGS